MTKPKTDDTTTDDDGPVWHLVAEVLPDSQVLTMCGRTVDRGSAGPYPTGRKCHDCETGDS